MSRFAEVAALLGYWPATTDEAHTLRAASVTRDDAVLVSQTDGSKWDKMRRSFGPR